MQVDYHFTERASRFLTNEADDCNCSPKDVVVRIIENAAERAELGLEKYEESLLRQLQLMRDSVKIALVPSADCKVGEGADWKMEEAAEILRSGLRTEPEVDMEKNRKVSSIRWLKLPKDSGLEIGDLGDLDFPEGQILKEFFARGDIYGRNKEGKYFQHIQLMRDGVTIDFVSFTYSSFRRKRCDGWFMCFLDDGKRYLYKFVRKEAGDFFLRLCELMDRLEKEDEIDDLEGVLAKLREGGGKK